MELLLLTSLFGALMSGPVSRDTTRLLSQPYLHAHAIWDVGCLNVKSLDAVPLPPARKLQV